MLKKPSLVTRVAVGKIMGFAIGVFAFFVFPSFGETDLIFRIGFVFWMTTIGALIGLFGVMTYYPIIGLPMPWWFRGPLIGGFLMLNLWMVAQEKMDAFAIRIVGADSLFSSGAWAAADGMFLGLVIAGITTWLGGEGSETVDNDRQLQIN